MPLDMSENEIKIMLTTEYSRKGYKELQRDLDTLKARRIQNLGVGAPNSPEDKARYRMLSEIQAKKNKQQRKEIVQGLSLLFLMQRISSTISSLTKPAADISGILELWSLILELFFLPAMLTLLPVFLALLKIILAIPAPVKTIVGLFIILVGLIASVIGFLVQLALALDAFAGAGAAAELVAGIGAAISGVIATIVASPILLFLAAFAAGLAAIELLHDPVVSFFTMVAEKVKAFLDLIGIKPTAQNLANAQATVAAQDQAFQNSMQFAENLPVIGGLLAPFEGIAKNINDLGPAGLGNLALKTAVNVYVNNSAGTNLQTSVDQTSNRTTLSGVGLTTSGG